MSRFGFSNAAAKPEPVNAPEVAEPTAPKPAPPAPADTKAFDQLDAKLRIHAKLIDELDLSVLDKLDDETMRRRVRGSFRRSSRRKRWRSRPQKRQALPML